MLNRLISLVILSLILSFSYAISSETNFILPKEKPSIFKKIDIKTSKDKKPIPAKKPIFKADKKEEKKPEVEKIIKKKESVKKEKIKQEVNTKITKTTKFTIPKKKPKTFKTVNALEKSKILNQKDFDRAKIVFENFKAKKYSNNTT